MLLYSLMFFYIILNSSLSVKIEDISKYLGTRTPYRFKYNKEDSKIKYPHCKDTKIWMVVRHGTRLPSAKDILGMNSVLEDLRHEILLQNRIGKGPLNSEQLDDFEKWYNNLEIEKEKFLTYEGQNEMILLAERTLKRFPNAIKKKYNNNTFEFRYTATQRAQQSARYFTVGLFDKKISQQVVFAPATKIDMVLRFYKHCDKWQKQVKKNSSTYKEQKIFGNSDLMNKTLESVSQRLGLNRTLSLDTVVLMYKICGYETSWRKNHISPWCYGFDKNRAEVLEYYIDLKHYWLDGYGFDLTYRQACILMKNLFERFRGNGANATFLFAHSGTLLKLLTHLELYKPERPLTGESMNKDRAWRASDIDCFASNLAFVLYKCKDGDYVLTLHQERIIKLPMCEKELCPLATLWNYFKDSINECDIGDICRLD
ncbi:multiple inositol polyphosphate phosphatase 1-like [Papilio machaon]|uniref:multiple inositol polyphosphate phosphatase 1-like n=1 Tax=Papilio machaon TaxID=76193 RepID=UPI001E6634AE|nr:multiple inositol polyphosphate phosphatase 1-like [Papilio machaon]